MASKAFRATLPNLSDTQLARVQSWAAANCATAVVFRDNGCTVLLLATRERAFTQEAFLRSVRSSLKRLNIDMGEVKRRWLSLTTEDAVKEEVAARSHGVRSAVDAPVEDPRIRERLESSDEDVRLIALPGAARRRAMPRPEPDNPTDIVANRQTTR